MTFLFFCSKLLAFWGENMKRDSIQVKALSIYTAISVLSTGFRLNELTSKKEITPVREAIVESIDNTRDELSIENYNILDSLEIAGSTMYIVSEEELDEEITFKLISEDGVVLPDPNAVVPLEFTTREEMISFYCRVFQLNEEIISNKINELINSDPYGWEYGYMVSGQTYETEEQAVARTICDMSVCPENFNLVEEEIRLEEYELSQYLPEELIYKFSQVVGINPNIALAVAYAESGRSLSSYNFTHNYNVAGLHRRTGDPSPTTSEGYIIFHNPADGLFRYTTILHDYFYVDVDSDINRINTMSNSYCAPSAASHWRSMVGTMYNEAVNYGFDYSYNTYTYQDRDLIYPLEENYVIEK